MGARPEFRLIASDIDGTLVAADRILSPGTLNTLRHLPELGVAFAFVTGLNPWVTERFVSALGPWSRGICLNGVFTLEGGRRVAGQVIDPEVAREAVSLSLDLGYVPLVYGEDHVSRYLAHQPDGANHGGGMVKIRHLIVERPYQPYVGVESFEALFTVPPAQVAICETPERGAALFPVLDRALGERAYVVLQPGETTWVEIAHPEARKDRGLMAMAHRLGLSAEQVLYFGDNLNDLPVFEAFPYTVAVANARPEISKLAWRTTTSNVEDGVARFIAEWFDLD